MTVRKIKYGLYNVIVKLNGNCYQCTSCNTPAWNRLDNGHFHDNQKNDGYTNKGAHQAFYDECLQKNNVTQ